MKTRLTFIAILTLSLFLLNSCDLLNPLLGNNKNVPIKDNFTIAIERIQDAIQGQTESVEITLDNNTIEKYLIGSFDIRLAYDASALVLQSADPGDFLNDCGWEYFTYRHRGITSDSSAFRIINIMAIAETNNGLGNHPNCFNVKENISDQLAVLNFLVTNDRAFKCEFAPIQFLWDKCRDNTVSGIFNKNIFLNKNIYNFIDSKTIDYSNNLAADFQFPSYYGATSICDSQIIDRYQQDPLRKINFINGGIDIICTDSIDGRGDMNLPRFVGS